MSIFNEISFLDVTKDGNFFLCHSKTKQKKSFIQTVTVFLRSDPPRFGTGITFGSLQSLSNIQLHPVLITNSKSRQHNLSKFRKEIMMLHAGSHSNNLSSK